MKEQIIGVACGDGSERVVRKGRPIFKAPGLCVSDGEIEHVIFEHVVGNGDKIGV